jgi:replication-associated recombination protein RarA
MIDSKNVMNMIFYGSPGTGKTSCANIITKSQDFDLISMNASLEKSLSIVKNIIEPFTTAMSLYQSKKIVFLDEADFLNKDAQAALRIVIEESYDNCRFILTANKLSKIDPAIQSRCLPICFDSPLKDMPNIIAKVSSTIKNRLNEVDVKIDDATLHEIVNFNYPDYRTIANKIEFQFL